MTAGLPLMKSVPKPLAKGVLLPLGLPSGMSAADAAIQNKVYAAGTTGLIIPNKEMEEIIKIVKSREESELLKLKLQLKIEEKHKKEDFFQCY